MALPNCVFCNTTIETPLPISMLLCTHVAHTYCMLTELTTRERQAQCRECSLYLVSDQMIHDIHVLLEDQEDQEEQEEQDEIQQEEIQQPDISGATPTIAQLFRTSTQFKKHAKEIQQQSLKALAAEKKVRKVRKQKLKEFMTSLSDIKDIVRSRRQHMKHTLKNSPEYKTYVHELNKLQTLNKKLENTYNVPYRRLINDLKDKHGFKNFPNVWRRHLSYLLRTVPIRI